MFGQDGASGAILWPNILECSVISFADGVMVDNKIYTAHNPTEVMWLYVYCGNSIEFIDIFPTQGLDLNIEDFGHSEIFWPGRGLECTNYGCCLSSVEKGSKGEAAGQCVWVWLVVQDY